MKIWIDADACPAIIKEIIFKATVRCKIETILVANRFIMPPKIPLVSCVQVESGLDVADCYIVNNLQDNDLVITADVPLAALVIEKNAIAINPRGDLYTVHTIADKLSIRNFMQDMRSAGYVSGGPATLDNKDKQKFAAALDKILCVWMQNKASKLN